MHLSQIFCSKDPALAVKRERRKEARPGELLDAALDLFVEKGFAATRVEEVAARAGVSKGTLFLYFPTKEELLKAVVRENIVLHFEEFDAHFDCYPGSSVDMLNFCLNTWWAKVGATKASGISKLMMSEAANFPEVAAFYRTQVVEPGNALIRRVLQRGVDRGEFRPMNLEYASYCVCAPVVYLMMARHCHEVCAGEAGLDPKKFIDMHVSALLYGFAAQAEAEGLGKHSAFINFSSDSAAPTDAARAAANTVPEVFR